MSNISFLLDTLNGREKVVLAWLLIFILWALVVLLMNTNKATQDDNYFRNIWYFSYHFCNFSNCQRLSKFCVVK